MLLLNVDIISPERELTTPCYGFSGTRPNYYSAAATGPRQRGTRPLSAVGTQICLLPNRSPPNSSPIHVPFGPAMTESVVDTAGTPPNRTQFFHFCQKTPTLDIGAPLQRGWHPPPPMGKPGSATENGARSN